MRRGSLGRRRGSPSGFRRGKRRGVGDQASGRALPGGPRGRARRGSVRGCDPGGWRAVPAVYAALLVVTAVVIFALSPTPDPTPGRGRPLAELLSPLRHARVWRFSLYYVVVFGAYVALSGWLPTFYKETFHVSLRTAALLTATFIFPASLLRPLGGWLSDRYGPRVVTYGVFLVVGFALVALSVPYRTYFGVPYRLGPGEFAALMFVVGCGMGIGKAAVFKYVPNYFPRDVGAVGGLVGMLGRWAGLCCRRSSVRLAAQQASRRRPSSPCSP